MASHPLSPVSIDQLQLHPERKMTPATIAAARKRVVEQPAPAECKDRAQEAPLSRRALWATISFKADEARPGITEVLATFKTGWGSSTHCLGNYQNWAAGDLLFISKFTGLARQFSSLETLERHAQWLIDEHNV